MIVRHTATKPPAPSAATTIFTALAGIATLAMLAAPASADAQTHDSERHTFTVDTVATGLENPWGMAFLPDGDVLVTERPGRLRIVRDGALDAAPIEGLPRVYAAGQGGLLDVAIHPDFASNRLVYLSYSKPGSGGEATTSVIRGRLEGGRLADVEEIFEMDAWRNSRVHFGSRLAFDGAGHLFITMGERGQMEAAQDLSNHQGVTIRLHDDGRVPRDNPFVGRSDARPEIWTYGNRSPQGLTFHPETGDLWQVEHGPRGGDELNILRPGRNYGWPVVSYGTNYDGSTITDVTEKEGMEQPVHYWVPSIATSGLAIYHGDAFPNWRGDAFVGGLRGQQLARVDLDGNRSVGWETLLEGYGRIRDVRVGPAGLLYLLVDDENAPLVRLVPAG